MTLRYEASAAAAQMQGIVVEPFETPPHVRVSLDWADVEALVETLAEKGHPSALRLERARKLAAAVDEFWAARPSCCPAPHNAAKRADCLAIDSASARWSHILSHKTA
jgi:hypothetical protein